MITDEVSSDGVVTVLANYTGEIQYASENMLQVFGYPAIEITGENMSVLLPDSQSFSHGGIVTEESNIGMFCHLNFRVDGGHGRHVEGKRRNGTPVPLVLKIATLELYGSTFFTASMWDSGDLVGIVFINGRGLIVNCDPSFALMYGYSKDELVTQNIKIIMPSPYTDFHDQYLERYRTSGKGRILGSGGRKVPSVHADGSIFDIEMKVTREDSGDLSNWETMMFKGIVKRSFEISSTSKRELETRLLTGFDSKVVCRLDESLDIISLSPDFVSMLGYKPDQDFRGISVGVLLHCSDGSFSKGWLRGLIIFLLQTIRNNLQ
jgi:PAS domain S-box-containing protein